MTIDPTVIPGLLLVAAEFAALAAVGFVIVRVALRQTDDRMALAQGLVVGLALWGLIVNLVMYAVPGLAGAIVGWGITLSLGAVLAWRAPHPIRPRPRVMAGFLVAVLALFWVALASRQLLGIADVHIHLQLAATIRAGGFPPELPWSPGMPAQYHYGEDLLVGLLAPPFGPDLAFVTEILGAYAWTSLMSVLVTALLRRASAFAVAVSVPLLLGYGTWAQTGDPVNLAQIPVATGIPSAGLRASLTEIYWPSPLLPNMPYGALPNVWKASVTLSYALAFVALEHAALADRRSWPGMLTLAGLVGAVGLLATSLAPVVLVLWAGLEAVDLRRLRRTGASWTRAALRAGGGLALAVLMLMVSGRLTGIVTGSAPSGLHLAWNPDPVHWQAIGTFDARPGGVGLLGAGPLAAAGGAVMLARRDRLVATLAVGAVALALAWIVLTYPPNPWDVYRFAGHARNLALVALLLALSARLTSLRPARWRYAAGALLLGLIIWPTIASPVRNLRWVPRHGVEIANGQPSRGPHLWFGGRYVLSNSRPSDAIAAYILGHTDVRTRVLTSKPIHQGIAFATGRPSAAGFVGWHHLYQVEGPEHLDARRYLDPAAIRRLGVEYVHATDAWIAGLPDQATRRLNDPRLFELLIRSGPEALYRVQPALLDLATTPAPGSYEALRQAVPASATVYVPAELATPAQHRVASVLSHATLLGDVDPRVLHLLTPVPTQPLDDQLPDLIVLPLSVEPWMLPPEGRQPIWWDGVEGIAVYAPHGAVKPIRPPPPDAAPPPESPPVSFRVSDVSATDGRLTFTVMINDHTPDQWTGQDWRLVAGEASPWAIPTDLEPDGRTPRVAQWFAGQMVPGRGTTTRQYAFDARTSRLALREDGRETAIATSGDGVGEGIWMLSLRLLRVEDRGTYEAQEDVAVIPLLQIEVSETGEVAGFVYDGGRGAEVEPALKP